MSILELSRFLCKHIAVVHSQTTRVQHKTLLENGHFDNSGTYIEFVWIRKGLHFQI